MPVTAANLGFPHIRPRREFKSAIEAYRAGKIDKAALLDTAKGLRTAAWDRQKAAGIDVIPSNDFSLHDQVLDTSVMLGAIPEIYRPLGPPNSLEVYFAMARGIRTETANDSCSHADAGNSLQINADIPPQESAKWFDTNYHYVVPEVTPGQIFTLSTTKPVSHFKEALALGHHTRPVILGPVTWLLLAKSKADGFDPLTLLNGVLDVYTDLLGKLQAAGAEWVQIDEPALVLDLNDTVRAAYRIAYERLAKVPGISLMLTTYFGGLGDNLATALALPVAGLHLDLVRAPEQLDAVLAHARPDLALSLGIIDGCNVCKADIASLLDHYEWVGGEPRVIEIAPSCSLLHMPMEPAEVTKLDPQVSQWQGVSRQKLEEIATMTLGLRDGRHAVTHLVNLAR